MAGTISFGGIGSGIDTESIVSGLTQVSKSALSGQKSRVSSYKSAISTMSDIGGALGKLKLAVADLDSAQEVGAVVAESTQSGVVASANGSALPGAYSVTVTKLAKEQRTYSNPQGSASTALGMFGSLDLTVGSGPTASITVEASDTLSGIADKINASGLRLSASVLFDGTQYRLQVRGLDSGSANGIDFGPPGGLGDSLGFLVSANTKQNAQNAELTVDGFAVTSSTNQVVGAIQGVTLALKEENVTSTVSVNTDAKGLGDKLQSVVDAYNSVIQKIHTAAGHGTTKASNPALSGDSALRGIASRLSSTLLQTVGNGAFQSLGATGVSLTKDGTLTLDRAKLTAALEKDRSAVTTILAGTTTGQNGIMDSIRDAVTTITDSKGPLQTRKDGLDSRSVAMQKGIDREEVRIARYADQLRKAFTAMDSQVAMHRAQLSSFGVTG